MRKVMLFFAVLGLAGSLWAADPIIGTWKLNVSKSKNLSSLGVMVQTETYREVDEENIEIAIKGIRADGSPLSYKILFPRQGGQVRYPQPVEEGRSEVETLIARGNWMVTWMQNGKQVLLRKKTVSKDGRTMRQILTGVADGKPLEAVVVYDKQ